MAGPSPAMTAEAHHRRTHFSAYLLICSLKMVQPIDGMGGSTMFRILAIATLAALVGCARPSTIVHYEKPQDDPMYQEIKALVSAQSDCFIREANSKSLKKVDIDTAALAVMGRCAAERQRYKAYAATHTIENPIQFEARWRGEEANDLQFIKQALALIRTGAN